MRDPNDRRSWSGTLYSMARSLERNCGEVLGVGPLLPPELKVGNVIRRGIRVVSRKEYLYTHTDFLARKLGKMAEQRLAKNRCDVIVAAVAAGIVPYLRTNLPIVYISDTTFRLMIGYNSEFSNTFARQVRTADKLEHTSIRKSSRFVYPSRWAADSAIRDYGAAEEATHVIPFGANLEPGPSREQALRKRGGDHCKLLFVGVNWEQKGGPVAFETLLELERLGIKSSLTVVGCKPPASFHHPRLRIVSFLDKNEPAEREQLQGLYEESSFLILPTRAECFGIVFCEASAYGLPSLAPNTGGVSGAIRDGVNGFLLPCNARGSEYAKEIQRAFTDKTAYQRIRTSSRDEYEQRLNWDAWGQRMHEIIETALAGSKMVQVA
ncbi:MAG: glycosyltransferase family 4 protein [Terriglobales bacterium]